MFDFEKAVRIGRFVFSDIDLYVDHLDDCFTLEYDFREMRFVINDLDIIQLTPDLMRVYVIGNYLFDYNPRNFPEWAQTETYNCESGGEYPAAFLAQLCYEIEKFFYELENCDLFN